MYLYSRELGNIKKFLSTVVNLRELQKRLIQFIVFILKKNLSF